MNIECCYISSFCTDNAIFVNWLMNWWALLKTQKTDRTYWFIVLRLKYFWFISFLSLLIQTSLSHTLYIVIERISRGILEFRKSSYEVSVPEVCIMCTYSQLFHRKKNLKQGFNIFTFVWFFYTYIKTIKTMQMNCYIKSIVYAFWYMT